SNLHRCLGHSKPDELVESEDAVAQVPRSHLGVAQLVDLLEQDGAVELTAGEGSRQLLAALGKGHHAGRRHYPIMTVQPKPLPQSTCRCRAATNWQSSS